MARSGSSGTSTQAYREHQQRQFVYVQLDQRQHLQQDRLLIQHHCRA